jgi:hypothetical protein
MNNINNILDIINQAAATVESESKLTILLDRLFNSTLDHYTVETTSGKLFQVRIEKNSLINILFCRLTGQEYKQYNIKVESV